MRPVARRFRLEIAGQVVVGLAFGDEAELEAWLLHRGASVIDARPQPPEPPPAPIESGRRGRPSAADAIRAARAALTPADLAGCTTKRDVARLVIEKAAAMFGIEVALRTVEDHLCEKSCGKSTRGTDGIGG